MARCAKLLFLVLLLNLPALAEPFYSASQIAVTTYVFAIAALDAVTSGYTYHTQEVLLANSPNTEERDYVLIALPTAIAVYGISAITLLPAAILRTVKIINTEQGTRAFIGLEATAAFFAAIGLIASGVAFGFEQNDSAAVGIVNQTHYERPKEFQPMLALSIVSSVANLLAVLINVLQIGVPGEPVLVPTHQPGGLLEC